MYEYKKAPFIDDKRGLLRSDSGAIPRLRAHGGQGTHDQRLKRHIILLIYSKIAIIVAIMCLTKHSLFELFI
jgi:hypothetical protein